MQIEKKEKIKPVENKEEQNRMRPWDIRPYLAVGLTAILVVFVSLLMFFFFLRFEGVSGGVGKAIRSLHGIIIGLILAYLLNPSMKFFERNLQKRLFKHSTVHAPREKRIIRGAATGCSMLCFLAMVVVFFSVVGPLLFASIQELILTLNDKLATLNAWIARLDGVTKNSILAGQMENMAEQLFAWLESWLQTKILSGGGDLIQALYTGVYSAIKLMFNILVGIIVAVYVLMTKENFVGQGKKLVYAVFKQRYGNIVMDFVQKADEVFGGFFIGKLIDSLIIGCICFGCMYFLKLPYTVLISVIIGVTNIIPFFGPFIGAVPSVILIFLVNPIQAIYFLILVLVLQQVDGNIIGPKILGNTTGLSPFWIVFACLLFGGVFGVVGMIFGVPIFAMIYYAIKRIAEHFLRRLSLPDKTGAYVKLDRVDLETNHILEKEESRKKVIQPAKRKRRRKKDAGKEQNEED